MFCDDVWSTNVHVDLHLWTEASDLAIGVYFGQEWFCEPFTGLTESYKCMSITWRELYAIVQAVATWCHDLKGKIMFHCDNEAVCHIIQSGTSKDPAIMSWIRALFFMSAGHDFASVFRTGGGGGGGRWTTLLWANYMVLLCCGQATAVFGAGNGSVV